MRSYLIALAIGVLVGVIYGVLRVRSPAPPVVALVGLLGMLAGEQLVPVARNLIAAGPPSLSQLRDMCAHGLSRCFRLGGERAGPGPATGAPDGEPG
jgi:XapX domain-containing protein